MIPSSVRWRLPLSYAAIVLVTALTLSGLLLSMLRGSYIRQENSYLTGNAVAMGVVMGRMLEQNPPQVWFDSQLNSFAILSQTRVRLFDDAGQLQADSGSLEEKHGVFLFEWDLSTIPSTMQLTAHTSAGQLDGDGEWPISPVLPSREVTSPPAAGETSDIISQPPASTTSFMYATAAAGTPFGFGLSAGTAVESERSDQVVREPFYDQDGTLAGVIELSEGPAYGRQILRNVAWLSAIAGTVAVLLSAALGWWMSRQVTLPLIELTAATALMAGGDLSARAELPRQDELGLLAKAFNSMAAHIETTVEASRRFAVDAAHQLQTPLTALRTNLELAPQDTYVQQAQDQARRLGRLAQSLLDLSRLETGNLVREKEPLDLVHLLQELGESYSSRAQQAGLAFDLELPDGPVTIPAHPGQLRQAVSNLLDNAIKFTPDGGRITLGLRGEKTGVLLWVEDTGIGIPEAEIPRMASRFQRGRNASQYPGNGLGLAIVKAVAGNHEASLDLESMEGRGTRVWLQFPGRS